MNDRNEVNRSVYLVWYIRSIYSRISLEYEHMSERVSYLIISLFTLFFFLNQLHFGNMIQSYSGPEY